MAGKWMDEGENYIAQLIAGKINPVTTLYLGLYKNSAEPEESDTLSNLTEVTGAGYARKELKSADATIDGDTITYPEQTFFCSGAAWGYVYGYFIATTVDNSGYLLSIEHFTEGYYIEGQKGIKIIPKIKVA